MIFYVYKHKKASLTHAKNTHRRRRSPIANLIRMNLTKAGYQGIVAADGKSAADHMMNESFDLLLLDIMLPELDGYELLEYAKRLGFLMIFLKALGTTEQKVKGLRKKSIMGTWCRV